MPIAIHIPLDDLRDWMLKHAKSERQNGEIAFANHTMNLRDAITRAAKKPPNQSMAGTPATQIITGATA